MVSTTFRSPFTHQLAIWRRELSPVLHPHRKPQTCILWAKPISKKSARFRLMLLLKLTKPRILYCNLSCYKSNIVFCRCYCFLSVFTIRERPVNAESITPICYLPCCRNIPYCYAYANGSFQSIASAHSRLLHWELPVRSGIRDDREILAESNERLWKIWGSMNCKVNYDKVLRIWDFTHARNGFSKISE